STAAQLEDDKLTVWLSTQTPHQDRDAIAGMLGREVSQTRGAGAAVGAGAVPVAVVPPDVGGGFGAKIVSSSGLTEEILVAWLAGKLGRPVRWTETRSESMLALPHGRAMQLLHTVHGET